MAYRSRFTLRSIALFVVATVVLVVQKPVSALDFMQFHHGEPVLWRAEDMPIPYWIDVRDSPWAPEETIALIRSIVEEMELSGTHIRFEYMGEWTFLPPGLGVIGGSDGVHATGERAPSGPVNLIRFDSGNPRASIVPVAGRITSFTVWMNSGYRDREHFRLTLLHELGHALGFGHNLDTTSNMFSTAEVLSPHDRLMLERFYGDRTFKPLTPIFPYHGAELAHPVLHLGGARLQFYWEPLPLADLRTYEVVFSRSPLFDDVVRFGRWENARKGAPEWCLCVELHRLAPILPWFDSGESIYWRVEAETAGGERMIGKTAVFRTGRAVPLNEEFQIWVDSAEPPRWEQVEGEAGIRIPLTLALSELSPSSCTLIRGAQIGVGQTLWTLDTRQLTLLMGDLTLHPGESRTVELALPDTLGVSAAEWTADPLQEIVVLVHCVRDEVSDRSDLSARLTAYTLVTGYHASDPSIAVAASTT